MRNRTPSRYLILKFAFIVVGIVCLSISIRTGIGALDRENPSKLRMDLMPTSPSDQEYDPFADPQEELAPPVSITVRAKFVEIGSGAEELGFDWILPTEN